MLYQVRMVTTQ